jgi:hypothetical protein
MYHALALLATAWAAGQWPGSGTTWAGWLFTAGIVIFSGSLYLLTLTGTRWLGAITPIGGVAFLAGWAALALAAARGLKRVTRGVHRPSSRWWTVSPAAGSRMRTNREEIRLARLLRRPVSPPPRPPRRAQIPARRSAMRAVLVMLTLLLGIGACALAPASEYAPGTAYQPLRASILGAETGRLGFTVNRAAHVALFEIVPGRGASLVYPGPGTGSIDGYTLHGYTIPVSMHRWNDVTYRPAVGTTQHDGPRFYFLIASETPLELDRFGRYGMGVHRAMGARFATYSPFTAMEQLADLALPAHVDDASWSSDVYVHWPQALSRDPVPGYVQVNCGNYSVFVLPQHIWRVTEALCRAGDPNAVPGDSTGVEPGVVEPQRRPPAQADEIRSRVRASSQLEEGGEVRRGATARAGGNPVEGAWRERPTTEGRADAAERGERAEGAAEHREGSRARAGSSR